MGLTNLTEIDGRGFKTPSSRLHQGIRSWGYSIADDEEPGTAGVDKFGRNPAAATGEAIQDEGGTIVINTTASKIELISDDTQDNPSGTGAKALLVQGVDINWNPIEDEIATNGTSASAESDNSYLYVYRSKIIDSGAQRSAGNITIRKTGAGATMAQITAGYGQTERAVMPVFAGCKLYINAFRFEGSKTGVLNGEIGLVEYVLNEGIRVVHPLTFDSGEPRIKEWREVPKLFLEKTLVWVEAIDLSTGAIITASFDGIMKRYEDSTP